MEKLKQWARNLKKKLVIVHLASKDSRTPWYAKALIYLIVAYALSPIDLIPDFIPVIGYLDDLLIVPLGLYFALKLVPEEVLAEARIKAESYEWRKSKNVWVAVLIILFWILIFTWIGYLIKDDNE